MSRSIYDVTPKTNGIKQRRKGDNDHVTSEWKLASIGLVASLTVLTAKFVYSSRENLRAILIDKKLTSYEVITESGDVVLRYAWEESVKYSRYWLPVLCGLLTTYFTWLIVYLDSNVPGIQPPSPLSPSKYKQQSGHAFHLNYIFALLVGIAVFFYMMWRGISL